MRGVLCRLDRQSRVMWSRSATSSRMMLVMCPIIVSGRTFGVADRPSGLPRSHASAATPAPPLHVRWAVKSGSWRPSLTQWNEALSLISEDEREKVASQHFFEDARARLTGQLLISKLGRMLLPDINEGSSAAHRSHCSDQVPSPVIVKRLPSGRPFIIGAPKDLQFSIAHDGMWVVLEASRSGAHVGCDIIETTRKTQLERLPRVFTDHEWKQVKSAESEARQRVRLMRRWAVKEAVVKALGVGIRFGMNNVEVDIANESMAEEEEEDGLRTSDKRTPKTPLEQYFDGSRDSHWPPCSMREGSSSIAGCAATVSISQPREDFSGMMETIPRQWDICLGKLDSDHLWASACGWDEGPSEHAAKEISSGCSNSANVPLGVMNCEELIQELMMPRQ